MNFDSRPIGVFDSGMGGLSVLYALEHSFPYESFIYLGDTARLPYGTKSSSTIQKYVIQNLDFLQKSFDTKALVVACNSASTVVPHIKNQVSLPLFEVIGPGSRQALSSSKNSQEPDLSLQKPLENQSSPRRCIGLMATRTTIQQKIYEKMLLHLDPKCHFIPVPCPLLVPLVEEGIWSGPLLNQVLKLYLDPLTQFPVDTIILGCTHYPFLAPAIKEYLNTLGKTHISLIDSAQALSKELISASHNLFQPSKERREFKICVTDSESHFKNIVLKAFPHWRNLDFELVDLQNF